MAKTIEELFIEHQEFCKETFPESNWYSSLQGLKKEIKEVEIESKLDGHKTCLEYIDCMMYLLDSMQRWGINMEEFKILFQEKIDINKTRVWSKNEDNTYSHIEKKIVDVEKISILEFILLKLKIIKRVNIKLNKKTWSYR